MAKDPELWFHTLATHFVEAQIYFHLNQTGVIGCLTQGGARSADIAERLGLDERILDILLDYAANIGDLIAREADGRYVITPFGERVLARYSKVNGDRRTYNLFDVRIGAWGPVWTHLGDMLTRRMNYGEHLRRAGEYAADGLFKLAAPLASAIERIAGRVQARVVVEIGPTSGILAQLAERDPTRRYIGVDRKPQSLEDAHLRAQERGVSGIQWVLGDLFAPDGWLAQIPDDDAALYFSCHFHEFLAGGKERVATALCALNGRPSTAAVVALEQPRLEPSQRGDVSTTQWLYNHSNVLIHHLIRNAKILSGREWQQLLLDGGSASVSVEGTECFGFSAFVGTAAGARRAADFDGRRERAALG